MNSALTTSLLKSGNSIENNALSSSGGVSDGLSNGLFAGELSTAMQSILATDGKFKPLDIAALKRIGIQQLTELTELGGIELPSQSLSEDIKLKLKEVLLSDNINLETGDLTEAVSMVGNPEAITLLKPAVIDDGFSESDLLNNQIEKPASLNKTAIADVTQQISLKKESVVTPISNDVDIDVDFSQYVKELTLKDTDINNELLTQTNRQETNVTKLVEQLASIDKPTNAINPVSNHSLKTYSNLEPSATIMNRIEVPVTQAGWSEAVGNRLMMMVNGKMQSANIHLNPAELGPIEIRVNVNQDQASVHFVSNNSVVRDAIEEAFPRLKEMFMQNGLSLADANVSQQSSQQNRHSSGEQNNVLTGFNEEALETVDVKIDHANDNMIDIGLIDHYV